jgi:hypothetical protein
VENKIRDAFKDVKAEAKLKEDTLKYILENQKKGIAKPTFFPYRRVLVACASLFLLLIIGTSSYNYYFTESAYIDIDVNPSIELTVNRFNRVIDAYAYNKDGKQVLTGLDVKHKSYDDAVEILMKEMNQSGYLKKDSLLSATVRTDWEESSRLERLERTIRNMMKKTRNHLKHEVYAVDIATKEHAHNENVSPAKYLAIMELQKIAPDATVEGCRSHSISEIRDEISTHESDHHNADTASEETNEASQDTSNHNSGHNHNNQINETPGSETPVPETPANKYMEEDTTSNHSNNNGSHGGNGHGGGHN